jgi:peptidoglycan/LPS O-acetylase OafA/YrhL
MIKNRISILDGFRAIAIIAVMFFHYFSRWTLPWSEVTIYPYKNDFNYFNYGYLGVQFFFIISGFVIFFTLDKTNHFNIFWKKRMIRLFPSIFFASLLTLVVCRLFDVAELFPASHSLTNFFVSLTFIRPDVLNTIFEPTSHELNYISGSYWSLWPEIQFYLFSSVLFYANKEKFIKNFTIISIALVCCNHLIQNVQNSNKLHIPRPVEVIHIYTTWFINGFNLVMYLPFFCIGLLLYLLFKNKNTQQATGNFVKISLAFFLLYAVYAAKDNSIRIIYITMYTLFLLFIYSPNWLPIFENIKITNVGESSYFLYLIHENVGLIIITSLSKYHFSHYFIFPLVVMYLLIFFSNLYTRTIDKYITNWLKKKLL